MIFITVGSQKFQFNRLLKEVDRLVKEKKITEEVFAQTGYSDYKPKEYKYKEFLDRDEFYNIMSKCNKVITHGGTGAIIGAVKQEKKVIAVPRLKSFGEHVDNHQLQIISEFGKMNFIKSVNKIEKLYEVINTIENCELNKYVSNTNVIIESIEEFIED
ncbi:beta(1,3)galactosyltransferase EpsH [Clostridium botulinum]|nr:beta(1,3)galactosyltransferase EpsH [Clostridium botulinum]